MTGPPFYSSRLKIDWAKRHISDLNDEIGKFIAANPCRIVLEPDPQAPDYAFCVVRGAGDHPPEFALYTGDAVHNLRTALDHLAYGLVRLNDGDLDKVQFPFARRAESLEETIRAAHIDRAAPEVVDVIRSLKPYAGGNDALYGLHQLDIMDKHQLLLPVTQFVSFPNFRVVKNRIIYLGYEGVSIGPIKEGAKIGRVPADAEIQVDENRQPTPEIAFAMWYPFATQAIVPTLHQLTSLVEGVVALFEPFVVRH